MTDEELIDLPIDQYQMILLNEALLNAPQISVLYIDREMYRLLVMKPSFCQFPSKDGGFCSYFRGIKTIQDESIEGWEIK